MEKLDFNLLRKYKGLLSTDGLQKENSIKETGKDHIEDNKIIFFYFLFKPTISLSSVPSCYLQFNFLNYPNFYHLIL